MDLLHKDTTEGIIGSSFRVHNVLGGGLRERTYQLALAKEMQVPVIYDMQTIGQTRVDFLVNGLVLVEIKAADCFRNQDFRQLTNYLVAANLQIGLLLAFAKDGVKVKRVANLVSHP